MIDLASREQIRSTIVQHRFTDIDRFTEQLQPLSKVRMTQLSVEGLQCDFQLVAFNEVQIAFIKSSCPIFIAGEKSKDSIIFTCLLETTGPCIVSHNRKVAHHSLLGFDPNREIKLVLPPEAQDVSVVIKRRVLQEYLEVMERSDLDDRFWQSNYLHIPETFLPLRIYLQQLLYLVQHQPRFLQQPQMKKLLLEDFIPLLIKSIPPATKNMLTPPPPLTRSQLVKEAEEYMMAHLDQPLTLKELCKALHVSERPLFYGFQEVFGVSPMEYLKTQRLKHVREKLKLANAKTTSVMAIAQQYGFWSAGHFSRDYKQMFGELPSETLKTEYHA